MAAGWLASEPRALISFGQIPTGALIATYMSRIMPASNHRSSRRQAASPTLCDVAASGASGGIEDEARNAPRRPGLVTAAAHPFGAMRQCLSPAAAEPTCKWCAMFWLTRIITVWTSAFLFDAFSSREPASTSLENASPIMSRPAHASSMRSAPVRQSNPTGKSKNPVHPLAQK